MNISDKVQDWIEAERTNYEQRAKLRRFTLYGVMIMLSVVYAFPIFWMVKSAFQSSEEMYSGSIYLIPQEFTLTNITTLLFDSPFLTFYKNSIIVMVGVVVVTLVTSTLAGYALTRIQIRGKRMIANLTIFSYMYPPLLLAIPMFMLWMAMDMLNTYIGLILAQSALTVPFSIWLMWQFFQTVPISLEESSWMYGASRTRGFFDIALPMAKPGIIAVAIFAFAVSWNDFTMASILMRDTQMRTLPVGVMFFTEGYAVDWGEILAASFFICIPPFLLVYFLQRYLLRGFQLTS